MNLELAEVDCIVHHAFSTCYCVPSQFSFPVYYIHTGHLLANQVKHKGKKYKEGMLRGSEVSKDSYTTPLLKNNNK